METTRQLVVDGDEVTFAVVPSGQAMAVPEGGRTDAGEPILVATAWRDGKEAWSGVLCPARSLFLPIREQFTDEALERHYRAARAASSTQG